MFSHTIYYTVFGFLFFLVSSFFFDLVCREQYIDSTPYTGDSHSPATDYGLSFFIFFVFGAISLPFITNGGLLLLYIFIQLVTIGFSLVKISRADSKVYPIVVCDTLNTLLFITLIAIRYFF